MQAVISQPLGRTEGLRIVDASIRPSDAAFLAGCDRDVVVGKPALARLGALGACFIQRDMVLSEISKPSMSSSP